MIVTVFGGSRPDEETRRLAYKLGVAIAKSGHVLKNGGYDGTMEESARGCREYGGTVIGVCVEKSKDPKMQTPNQYNSDVISCNDLNDRIKELLNTEQIIVLPGQLGTVSEWIIAWEQAFERNFMIYVLGKRNMGLLEHLVQNGFVKEDKHLPYVKYAEQIDDIEFLKKG